MSSFFVFITAQIVVSVTQYAYNKKFLEFFISKLLIIWLPALLTISFVYVNLQPPYHEMMSLLWLLVPPAMVAFSWILFRIIGTSGKKA
jgi:hypothetical protein